MATFEVEKDGKRYQIDAPDKNAALKAVANIGKPSVVEDVAKALPSGMARGVIGMFGLPGDSKQLMGNIGDWVGDKMFGPADPKTRAETMAIRGGPGLTSRGISDAIGFKGYDPQTVPGQYAETIGEFAPAAIGGPSSFVKYGLIPAITSETAGQLTRGYPVEPYARVAGALIGPSIANAGRHLVTPFPTSPERAAAVDTLAAEGIAATAGQRTGSKALRFAEGEIGGHRAANMMEQQGEQFTGAILRRAGINENRATPEVIDHAFRRIGGEFDRLAANNQLSFDRQFSQDMLDTLTEYDSLVPSSLRAPIVEKVAKDIAAEVQGGAPMAGDRYQALRSRLDSAARSAAKDPQLSSALRDMKDSLDDAMERSIAATNPNDLGAWQEARRQYRNMIVIERAATGAGEAAAQGLISPAQLRNATVTKHGRRNYARGLGDFSDLAHAGETVMTPLPNSGTAGRLASRAFPAAAGGLAGALLTGDGYMGGLAAGLGATIGPAVAGRALMSRPVQDFVGNRLLRQPPPRSALEMSLLLSNASQPLRLPAPGP